SGLDILYSLICCFGLSCNGHHHFTTWCRRPRYLIRKLCKWFNANIIVTETGHSHTQTACISGSPEGRAGSLSSRRSLPNVLLSFLSFPAALSEPEICYVLDGILFLYGIILTALYCRVKIHNAREASSDQGKSKQNVEDGIYTGLTPRAQDTYETIGMKK
uniref:Fc fragment of IgE receptor Ig n=1 Tax=Fundulus heteroclitus TaxID=8078 RepID=A0A3Q2Q3U2_FUNHE